MGHVDVVIEVGNAAKTEFMEVVANVDTGATLSMLPRDLLEGLGIKVAYQDRFQIVTGQVETRDIGEVPVRIMDQVVTTQCIFGEKDDPALIGVVTLEQFLLGVDPVNKKLVKIPGLLYGTR